MENTQQPLGVKEAAAYLRVKPSYLYNLVHYRKITAYKPGGKMLLFYIDDLANYVRGGRKSSFCAMTEKADAVIGKIKGGAS